MLLIIAYSSVMAETKEEFYRKGLLLAGQGKFEEALSCYDEALKLDRDYLEVLLAKGKLLNTFGKEEDAEECFVKIMEIVPYNAASWYMQAEVLMEVFEYEEALNCCNKAIAKDVENFRYWETKGRIYYNWGDYESQLSDINEEENVAFYDKYEDALECFDRSLKYYSEYYDAWYGRGMALFNLERYDEAKICSEKCLELGPDKTETWVLMGNIFLMETRVEKSIECYDKALAINPCNIDALRFKIVILEAMNYFQQAVDCCDKILAVNPEDFWALFYKGLVYLYFLNDYEKAYNSFDKVPEDYQSSVVWFSKGECLFKMTKYKEAVKCYDKALELEPGYPEAVEARKKSLDLASTQTETVTQDKNNVLRDYNTLEIYINNKPYKGRHFLNDDEKIYTSLKDLSETLGFQYEYDKSGNVLHINGEDYPYDFYLQNEKILYVPLTTLTLYLGYYVDYNYETNILDISTKPIYSSTTTATVNADSLIQPGINIGPYKIGTQTKSYIESVLGMPLEEDVLENGYIIYIYDDIAFAFDPKTQMIEMLMTRNSKYRTSAGYGVGSDINSVTGAYQGEMDNKENAYYCYEGIAFYYSSSTGKVDFIIIFRNLNLLQYY